MYSVSETDKHNQQRTESMLRLRWIILRGGLPYRWILRGHRKRTMKQKRETMDEQQWKNHPLNPEHRHEFTERSRRYSNTRYRTCPCGKTTK